MLILRFIFMFFLSRVDRVKDAVSTWKKLNLTWEIIYLFTPNWWGVSPLQDENEQKTSKRPTNVCEHCIVKTWCRAALASAIGGGAACRRPSPGGTKTAHFWHWPFSGSLRRLLPLGKGSYGEVFACHHRHQGKHFALKRMSKGLIVAETYVSCEWDVSTGVIRIFGWIRTKGQGLCRQCMTTPEFWVCCHCTLKILEFVALHVELLRCSAGTY